MACEPGSNSPDSFRSIERLNIPALESMLIGQSCPLNPEAFTSMDGLPEYAVRAIVLAVNDAYEHPLSTESAAE